MAAFSGRTFASQVLGFLSAIRRAHPEVPIAVISPVLSLPREEAPNAVGWTLADYRKAVADVVGLVRERGIRALTCWMAKGCSPRRRLR